MTGVLVTGANGFIGTHLVRVAQARGYAVTAAVRRADSVFGEFSERARIAAVGDIGPETDWADALAGASSVLHLAGLAHGRGGGERADDTLERVNVQGTETLARAALRAGVRRFVYVSSVKVLGETTSGDEAFTERNIPRPADGYAESKLAAERAVQALAEGTDMDVTIIRPPMVCGPTTRGNLYRLLRLVDTGVPLPFAGIDNRRSLIGVSNLADLILRAVETPGAAGETFLAADADLSTPELLRRIGWALDRPVRLFKIPTGALRLAGRMSGRAGEVERLVASLRVDASHARRVLGWVPARTLDDELEATASWYRRTNGREVAWTG